jgi:hypothetical protein
LCWRKPRARTDVSTPTSIDNGTACAHSAGDRGGGQFQSEVPPSRLVTGPGGSQRPKDGARIGVKFELVEQGFELSLLESEVRLHDGREAFQMPREIGGRFSGLHCSVESGEERGDHVVILLEHADDARRLGVLCDEGWEEQRVFPSMMPVEGHAESEAEEQ